MALLAMLDKSPGMTTGLMIGLGVTMAAVFISSAIIMSAGLSIPVMLGILAAAFFLPLPTSGMLGYFYDKKYPSIAPPSRNSSTALRQDPTRVDSEISSTTAEPGEDDRKPDNF